LGTATPSVESYYNAQTGKYGFVYLGKRHSNISLPHIEVVNTKELRRKKIMKSFISPFLSESIDNALSNKEQVILFQNRRGFAPFLECKACAFTPKCDHCDVSLTYHKNQNILICHYCGATYSVPNICPECRTEKLDVYGYGTERVEEEVSQMFPDNSILRMDLDTTRSKHGYEKIINDFAANKASILIGTQMVSKGLDFENVSIVGILSADTMLNYPDFRAFEKAFQMLTQVSGRAGRKNKQGTVILQTSQPNHPIISFVKNNDYKSLYESQIEERKLFSYPPFYRIIEVTIRSKDVITVQRYADKLALLMQQTFKDKVLGPSKPLVSRIQNLHIRKILLKIDVRLDPKQVRDAIEFYRKQIVEEPDGRSLLISFNVDPL
jgi:primosomal protein N' (replication factor Y)